MGITVLSLDGNQKWRCGSRAVLMKNKNIAQCRPKNKYSSARISGEVCPHISVWCSLRQFWAIAFLLNPLIIFGWCRYGNVRLASCGDSFRDTATGNRSWPMSARIVFYPSLSRIFFAAMVGYIFLCLFYQCWPMSTETQRRLSSHEIPQATSMVNLLLSEIKKENLLDRTKTIIGRRCWNINKKLHNVGKKKNLVPSFPARLVHKNQSGLVYDWCGLLFSVQSLNNFLMMTTRNCSVGFIRWCFLVYLDW